MAGINGITIKLYTRVQSGTDAFNKEIFTETAVDVDDVLVAPMSSTELLETFNLTGRKAVYQLGIPKGDTHDWTNQRIQFFGETWQSFGFVIEGIEDNIPLSWHKKVMVERYG